MMGQLDNDKKMLRVDALDSARGWAILGVIAIHTSQAAHLESALLLCFPASTESLILARHLL